MENLTEIYRKTSLPNYLFYEVSSLQRAIFLKKRLQCRFFSWFFGTIFNSTFSVEHLWVTASKCNVSLKNQTLFERGFYYLFLYFSFVHVGVLIGSRTTSPLTITSPDNCPPDNSHSGQLASGQLPPRATAPWTIPLDNSHLGLLNCSRIIRLGQFTTFSRLFSVSFPWSNYVISVFCYDNKINKDNSNKTWSLKLLSVIIL